MSSSPSSALPTISHSLRIYWPCKKGKTPPTRLEILQDAMYILSVDRCDRPLPKTVFISDAEISTIGARDVLNDIKKMEPSSDWNKTIPKYFGGGDLLVTFGCTDPWYVDAKSIDGVCIKPGNVLYIPIYRGMDITYTNAVLDGDFNYINVDNPFGEPDKVKFIWTGCKFEEKQTCTSWIDHKYVNCTFAVSPESVQPVSTESASSSVSQSSSSAATS